ncbi:pyridoxamine 5'-phosphate oxidase family protein [Streptomyces sp. NPDC016459]|uniref:pyridoxamine 5'-phosphate oxidase family protein n=1 Tax=Streptomyces sp. NPDC016459 TaxID=3157190 RepID=UPI0033F864A3
MSSRYAQLLFTPDVQHHQDAVGSGRAYRHMAAAAGPDPDQLGPDEQEFILERDSFYMASINTGGWPYVQHRGGPPGFLQPLDGHTLAYADFRGNRQYITNGNLDSENRVALILMDYPRRIRLKILGRARVKALADNPYLAERLRPVDYGHPHIVERLVVIDIEAFDWNCPQHITPRFTPAELQQALDPVRSRINHLEQDNDALRKALADHGIPDPTSRNHTAD